MTPSPANFDSSSAVDTVATGIAAAGAAIAAALFLPGCPDSFELPKHLVWGATAAGVAAAGLAGLAFKPRRRRRGGIGLAAASAGMALSAWMALRSAAAAPFWRMAPALAAWLAPPALFLAASMVRWSRGGVRFFARTVALTGLAEAALMLLQRAGLDPVLGGTTSAIAYAPGRMVGTVGYQNQAAEFLGVALCCVPLAWKRFRWRLTAIVPLVATTILTANRGAILAFATVATLSIAAFLRSKSGRRCAALALMGAICAAALAAAVPETRSRVADVFRPGASEAVTSRTWMARVALSLWHDHPVLGAGAGAFGHGYIDRLGSLLPEKKDHMLLRSLVWAREAHCDPIQFAAEFGLAGLALLAIFATVLFRRVRRTPEARAAMSACAFVSVCSLFSFSWQTSLAAPAAALLLGMAAGSGRYPDGGEAPVPPGAAKNGTAGSDALRFLSTVAAVCAAAFALFVPAAELSVGYDPDESSWDAMEGVPPRFLKGRWLAEAALFAYRCGRPDLAASLGEAASIDWSSPDLFLVLAESLDATGRPKEALPVWLRLARSGLKHHDALRGLSRCQERLGMKQEAAATEAERFNLWGKHFSDAEVYRLCALSLIVGESASAERISRQFYDRCRGGGMSDAWTPEWDNLRGSALLAIGRTAEARKFFEEALRQKPELSSARRNLEALDRQGQSR